MKKIKRKVLRWLIALIILAVLIIGVVSWLLISQKAPAIFGEVVYHVPYKKGLTLDVYQPTIEKQEPSPVVVYFHGGAWIGGSKTIINANRINEAVNTLRDQGYSFVCPDYSLASMDQPPFPIAIQDAHDVLQWISENAEAYQFDLTNVGVMGESAGAHIAMMMTFAESSIVDEPTKPFNIQYLIDIYGPSDLEGIYNMPTLDSVFQALSRLPLPVQKRLDIHELLFGFDPKQDSLRAKAFMRKYSPVDYVDESTPPVLLIHGTKDRIVPFDQSVLLEDQLNEKGIEQKFIQLKGVDHAFRGITESQKDSVQQEIVSFILNHYVIQEQ